MTDEENQRQRAYAATLIAQCDGKTVQMHDRGREAQPYEDVCVAAIYIDMTQYDIRIKPEPREWWICVECSSLFAHNHNYHNRHDATSVSPCRGVPIHVREIFEP